MKKMVQDGKTVAFKRVFREAGVNNLETVTRFFKKVLQISAVMTLTGSMIAAVPAQVYGNVIPEASEETVQTYDRTEELSYEKAIEELYQNSGRITDEQILVNAKDIHSDTDVLYSKLKTDESADVLEALNAYEDAKVKYLTSAINETEPANEISDSAPSASASMTGITSDESAVSKETAVCQEWERQSEYAQMMISEGSVIREMIPRYQVLSCTKTEDGVELDVEEWMTQGFSASAEADAVNASAYSYTFTLTLECDENGAWTPSEIKGTDSNFAWLGEGEDPVTESEEAPETLYEVKSDMDAVPKAYAHLDTESSEITALEDGVQETGDIPILSYEIDESAEVPSAAVLQAKSGEELTADTMYAQGSEVYAAASSSYTYKPAKAAAYADKYWKHYNHSYKEYRGVDCANFVSQCLYAGGMPKTNDWYPQSVNWINVMGHIRHFKSYGAFVTATNSSVRYGNPVYYDWNGNGIYDHVGICVGKNSSGMPVVDAHTNNVYHVPWRMGSNGRRGTILLSKSSSSGTSSSSNSSGKKNVWQTVSGKVYYIGSDGKKVKSKFLTINGHRYYFNSKGERVTGFFKVGSKWYYASIRRGYLLKGWHSINGKIYYFSVKNYVRAAAGMRRIGKYTYYFNSKGVRQVSFIKVGSKWYYADKTSGRFITGWRKISGEWYYFDKKTMVKAIGWKTINGQRCYFDSNGILRKGKHG